jgi:hypothetical protein
MDIDYTQGSLKYGGGFIQECPLCGADLRAKKLPQHLEKDCTGR